MHVIRPVVFDPVALPVFVFASFVASFNSCVGFWHLHLYIYFKTHLVTSSSIFKPIAFSFKPHPHHTALHLLIAFTHNRCYRKNHTVSINFFAVHVFFLCFCYQSLIPLPSYPY
ncbi:hypothetical protein K435DRAFT_197230 [Dendrothele bispora CBS 962.96]|uniref:Uncharacterized protein n=1 Tax=Dendrothele bispora (strain CBS 962.96) TaxID=1314807 RepID=A0A4S8LV58_DENBC|nr:hypothetical protein K435DRAFT_197230 [Dendrothele bispora CBS 962.96]